MKTKLWISVFSVALIMVLGLGDSSPANAGDRDGHDGYREGSGDHHDRDGYDGNWGWFGGHHDRGACARSQSELNRNVKTAVAYYTLAFNAGEPALAVEKYVGVDRHGNKIYTQHNPFAADGPEAFIAFVTFFKGLYPDLHVDIKRTIAQCDLVMTHANVTTGPNDLGNAAMDIFRFDRHGKIVEHWDAVQPVEATSANDNTQF